MPLNTVNHLVMLKCNNTWRVTAHCVLACALAAKPQLRRNIRIYFQPDSKLALNFVSFLKKGFPFSACSEVKVMPSETDNTLTLCSRHFLIEHQRETDHVNTENITSKQQTSCLYSPSLFLKHCGFLHLLNKQGESIDVGWGRHHI